MGWNRKRIDSVAIGSSAADHAAFEAIGLSEMNGARILDVGAFDGLNTRLKFAPYDNIAQIVGVDPETEALAIARESTDDPRFTWVESSLEDFKGTPNSFDVVYFSHTFQHLPDKQAAAHKVFELLAPGGWVVIKTVDDATKVSSPDPDHVMERLLELFEAEVRPNRPHLRHTDYYNGTKCLGLLEHAGFESIEVEVFHSNTVGKTLEERLALFDRMTYFRQKAPEGAAPGTQEALDDLLGSWQALFEQEGYYFDASTFMWIAQKPTIGANSATAQPYVQDAKAEAPDQQGSANDVNAGENPASAFANQPNRATRTLYESPRFPQAAAKRNAAFAWPKVCQQVELDRQLNNDPSDTDDSRATTPNLERSSNDDPVPAGPQPNIFQLEPMTEADLGEVMDIELRSFPDPWTPVAYAMEIRHDPHAFYMVARDHTGKVRGYMGWWYGMEGATIANIAVDPTLRRSGLGRAMVEASCQAAKEADMKIMRLQVREANTVARSFYAALGFEEVARTEGYYTNPDDNAIIMVRML